MESVEVLVPLVVNELIEAGHLPPEFRGEAITALRQHMRRHARAFVCNLVRAGEDAVTAAQPPAMPYQRVS